MGWMWIIWVVVIVAVILLVRAAAAGSRRGDEARETPEQILKRRYAAGEIGEEEYQRKLEDLRR